MFSLVIVIIAIALVSVLALATVYYGSDAFQGNRSDARFAEIANQSEQILGAFIAFRVQGNQFDTDRCSGGDTDECLEQLVETNYLSAIPDRDEAGQGWDIQVPAGEGDTPYLFTTTADKEACIRANENNGFLIDEYPEFSGDVPASEDEEAAVQEGAVCVEDAG